MDFELGTIDVFTGGRCSATAGQHNGEAERRPVEFLLANGERIRDAVGELVTGSMSYSQGVERAFNTFVSELASHWHHAAAAHRRPTRVSAAPLGELLAVPSSARSRVLNGLNVRKIRRDNKKNAGRKHAANSASKGGAVQSSLAAPPRPKLLRPRGDGPPSKQVERETSRRPDRIKRPTGSLAGPPAEASASMQERGVLAAARVRTRPPRKRCVVHVRPPVASSVGEEAVDMADKHRDRGGNETL